MKIAVIRAHMASVGYEDSNPFSLCKWVVNASKEGYTEIVNGEFNMWMLTPQNKELIGEGKDAYDDFIDTLFVSEYREVYTKEWLMEEYSISECEELTVVAPISETVSTRDGDIEVTVI